MLTSPWAINIAEESCDLKAVKDFTLFLQPPYQMLEGTASISPICSRLGNIRL